MNQYYKISLSIVLILQTAHLTSMQPSPAEQKKAVEGLVKLIEEVVDKKLKNIPAQQKNSALSDEDKKVMVFLQQAPQKKLVLTPAEKPLANMILRVLQLTDELKYNSNNKMSIEKFVVDATQNQSLEYHAQSKAASHGWLDLQANLSLLSHWKYANQNQFDITIKQSIEYPEDFELIIHAHGTCDTTNKDLQAAHCQLAEHIKNSPNFIKYANFNNINSQAQAERETRLQGESSGTCYNYGCQKKIRIICNAETLIHLIKEKNNLKHTFNTVQDESFLETPQPKLHTNFNDVLASIEAKMNVSTRPNVKELHEQQHDSTKLIEALPTPTEEENNNEEEEEDSSDQESISKNTHDQTSLDASDQPKDSEEK